MNENTEGEVVMRTVEASERTEPYQGLINRPARVSPEIAEFLHMLSSLESRLIEKSDRTD